MKKLSFAIMGLAIAGLMTFSSCKKPNSPIYNGGGELHTVTFTASTGDGSKTTVVGKDIFWKANDKINVNGTELTLDEGYGGQTSGQFTGDVEGDEYFATYLMDGNNGTQATYLVPSAQNYADLTDKLPMAAYTTTTSLNFKTMVNVLKLTIKPESGKSVKINSFKISSTKNLYGTTTAKKSGTDQVILYAPIGEGAGTEITVVNSAMTLSASTDYYVILPVFPTDDDLTLTFKGDEETDVMTKTITTVGATSPNNLFTTGDITVTYPAPPTPPEPDPIFFSVGFYNQGTKVYLNAVSIASSNMYWDGDSYEFRSDPFERAGEWVEDDVDLFMFNSDPATSRARTWSGSMPSIFYTNATATTPSSSFTIGGETGVWRLLSRAEWDFLTGETRNDALKTLNGLDRMCGFQKVNGQLGFVIFPDNYKNRGGGYPSAVLAGVGIVVTDDPETCGNTTTEWWNVLAGNGVVFLPLTGCRHGNGIGGTPGVTEITNQNTDGVYMTSNTIDDKANKFTFSLNPYQYGSWYHWTDESAANDAKGVRLVKNLADQPMPTK